MKTKQDLINELTDRLAHYKKLACDIESSFHNLTISERFYIMKMSEYTGAITALESICSTIYQLSE